MQTPAIEKIETRSTMSSGLKDMMVKILSKYNQKKISFDYQSSHDVDILQNRLLKDINKMLSKWNKPSIKQFLQTSTLFDFVDK
jgi:hypothetical protein